MGGVSIRKRLGLIFINDEQWVGGTYYIINLIHANNVLNSCKTKLKLGIFSNYYDDGRTNEHWLISTLENNSQYNELLEFLVYGTGWNGKLERLMSAGFCVTINDNRFNNYEYDKLMDEIDYFVYLGYDEGSMAFLDASSKDKKTIAIPQGSSTTSAFLSHIQYEI